MDNENQPIVISYLRLRKLLGTLGILLPVFLVVGVALFSADDHFQPSISDYYHTDMRDVFVGFMIGFSFFLFTYSGYKGDRIFTALAGIAAMGVAFFPTAEEGADCNLICTIHFICGVVFFLVLSIISFFLFVKSDQLPEDLGEKKKNRNRIYRICGIIMFICLVIMALYFQIFEDDWPKTTIFWGETIALWAFGVSWLVKGEAISILND